MENLLNIKIFILLILGQYRLSESDKLLNEKNYICIQQYLRILFMVAATEVYPNML